MKEYFYRLSGWADEDDASEHFATAAEAVEHGEGVARELAGAAYRGKSVLTLDENKTQIGQAPIESARK